MRSLGLELPPNFHERPLWVDSGHSQDMHIPSDGGSMGCSATLAEGLHLVVGYSLEQ